MPEENPGDVFLRHSDAVLDALLADPGFEQSSTTGTAAVVGATGGPAARATAVIPPDEAASLPPATPLPSAEELVTAASAASGSSTTAARRSGPKASETINAILSGRIPPSATLPDYADLPNATASGAGESAVVRPPDPPHHDDPNAGKPVPSDPFAMLVQRALALRKRPKLLIAIGAAFVVLLILLLIATSGHSSGPSEPLVITPSPRPAATTTPPPGQASGSSPIQVKSATSSCPPGSTSAMDAFDSQSGKAWDCVRAYSVDGQVMTIDLGKSYSVDSIGIVPGWDHVDPDGTDEWTKHRTVHMISYQFNDSNQTTYTQETMDQRTEVVTKIDPPVTASKITLTVLESSGDKSVNDTALSSVVITGH
jgi:hypothetical protein